MFLLLIHARSHLQHAWFFLVCLIVFDYMCIIVLKKVISGNSEAQYESDFPQRGCVFARFLVPEPLWDYFKLNSSLQVIFWNIVGYINLVCKSSPGLVVVSGSQDGFAFCFSFAYTASKHLSLQQLSMQRQRGVLGCLFVCFFPVHLYLTGVALWSSNFPSWMSFWL